MRPSTRRLVLVIGIALLVGVLLRMTLLSSGSRTPRYLGLRDGALTTCPSTPNCVSSDAPDETHFVSGLEFGGDPNVALERARQAVEALPRTRIVDDSGNYIHAECRSLVFRFVDDLELHLRQEEGVIAVRSASRVGTSDMGVNRKRVEALRQLFRELESGD